MKKLRFLLLFVMLLCLITAGCTAPVVDAPAEELMEEQEAAEEPLEEDAAEEAEAEPQEMEPTKEDLGKELKVIFLVPGSIDRPAYMAAYASLQRLEQMYGSTIGFVEMGDDEGNWDAAFAATLEEDWDIIVTDSPASGVIEMYAGQYQGKRFIVLHEYQGTPPSNVFSIGYKTNEAAFLAGACAASVTQSDMALANSDTTIGFLGGMNIPLINDFLVGYIEGAQYVNPDIGIFVLYAENFGDFELGSSLASDMYDNGADIIYNVAGFTGQGLFEAAKAKGGYAIGVDFDQSTLFETEDPDKAALILTSVIRKQGNALFFALDKHLTGELEYGTIGMVGIAEDAVGLVKNDYYGSMNEDIKTLLEELEERIFVGEIVVGSAFVMSPEEVNALIESVKP